MFQYDPLNLKKRFVYIGEEIAVDAIASKAARGAMNIPSALKDILAEATKLEAANKLTKGPHYYLEQVRHNIINKGKEAAMQAIRQLGPNATKAEAEAAARNAIQKIAQAEAATAKSAAEGVIRQHAQKLAAETAARKVAEQAAKKTAEQAAKKTAEQAAKKAAEEAAKKVAAEATKKAAEQGGKAIVRVGAEKVAQQAIKTAATEAAELAATRVLPQVASRGAMVVASEAGLATTTTATEVALTGAAEGAAVGGAALAGAIAAAVVGVGLAGWQGYELYKDVERGGWVTKGEMEANAARQNAARYNAENVDADTQEAARAMNDQLRGASMVARNSASDIIVETRNYGDLAGDKERLGNLITYSGKAKVNLQNLMDKADKNSAIYKEAEKAMGSLTEALTLAGLVYSTDSRPSEDNDFVKKAVEARAKAQLERRKTGDIINIDEKIKVLGTLEDEKKSALIDKFKKMKDSIAPVDNEKQYNETIVTGLNVLHKEANDLILAEETKLTPENAAMITKLYLARNITNPELRNNAEFVTRMMGLAAGLVTPNMTVKQFDAAMRSAFENGEFAPDKMVPISKYFEQVTEKNGKPAIKGVEWNAWDPFTVSYLVGLAQRAKNHPALGEKSDQYTKEIQKMFHESAWQKTLPSDAQYGGPAFHAFIVKSLEARKLSSPEQFFNYQEKPADDASKAPRTVGDKLRVGGGERTATAGPETAEKSLERNRASGRAKVQHLANTITGEVNAVNLANSINTYNNLTDEEKNAVKAVPFKISARGTEYSVFLRGTNFEVRDSTSQTTAAAPETGTPRAGSEKVETGTITLEAQKLQEAKKHVSARMSGATSQAEKFINEYPRPRTPDQIANIIEKNLRPTKVKSEDRTALGQKTVSGSFAVKGQNFRVSYTAGTDSFNVRPA